MDTKAWWWVLGVVVIGVGGYFAFSMTKDVAPAASQEEVTQQPEATSDTSIRWSFGIMSEDSASGAPMREVSVAYKGQTHVIGTYQGSCSVVEDSSWPLLENELTGVICWWAGGGTEVGVFYDNGKRVVKVGSLEEGTAEEAGFRGDFKQTLTLD